MIKRLGQLSRFINRLEDSLLIALLTFMILFAFLQIVLRNFAGTGIIWGEALLQHLVLWLGLLGAMVATRKNNHITIDITQQLLTGRLRTGILFITNLFAMLVCALLAHSATIFVMDEKSFGSLAFAKVPTWVAEFILPLAFTVITLRFAAHTVFFCWYLIKGVDPPRTQLPPVEESGS